MRRWIPGTEIVADANVSHATDWYLPEHVFEGTPMFPGVMAIEAMVQAAMACAGREDLPVLRNIFFRRPLIVPEDASVIVRTLALADEWGAQPPPAAAIDAPVDGSSPGDEECLPRVANTTREGACAPPGKNRRRAVRARRHALERR